MEDKKEKKKPGEDFSFDLEWDLQDQNKCKEILKQAELKEQKLKNSLRSGDEKEQIEHYNTILNGYQSLLKVVNRAQKKK